MKETLLEALEKRWVQKFALGVIVLGAVMVLYISYLLLYPFQPLNIVQPYKVINPQINQGAKLSYEVEYCVKKDIVFQVERSLVNIETLELWDVPDRINSLKAGCSKEVNSFVTPMRIDKGIYKMIATVNIQVNPIRTIDYSFSTEDFIVVK